MYLPITLLYGPSNDYFPICPTGDDLKSFLYLVLDVLGTDGFHWRYFALHCCPLANFAPFPNFVANFGLRALYSILLLHIQQVGLGWV